MTNWEKEILLPEKAGDIAYAYILKSDNKINKCDGPTLLEVIENNSNVKFVATPEHETFIIPGADFYTIVPILKRRISEIKTNLTFAKVYIAFFGGIMLLFSFLSGDGFFSDKSGRINLLVFGIIPLLNGYYDLYYLKRINSDNYFNEALEEKFNFWLKQKYVISIYFITAVLVIITIMQFITGLAESVDLVGLVKPATRHGEYWRLLTCTMLHGSIMHILFNGIAIFVIGHMLIRITGLSYFVIVFLFSGIIGSLLSVFFLPNITSVGASGGIMGLIGFILVISLKLRKSVPRNIIKSMLNSIILIGIMGLFAFDIIDNAAHAGGLLGGIFLGIILIRKKQNSIPYKPSIWINILGFISSAVLIYGIILIISKLT